jgi:hypothetical protein
MPVKSFAYSIIALFLVMPAVLANAGACTKCHEAAEFTGMSADDIAAAARDISIPPHKKITDLSDEQLEAIAAELAGS